MSQNLDSPSEAPSFTPGSLLADLRAQLAAASLSSAPLIPIVQTREYPAVVPVDLNWRDHPRWKPLITTPSRTPNQSDPLVPDRSPTPSAWSNCSDIEDSKDASPGSFIHQRRRKEYVHRAPVWMVRGRDEGLLENDDPFMSGHQCTILPNPGPSDEYFRCIAAQAQPMGGFQTASIPHIFDQNLEIRPAPTTAANWPLSKDNHQTLPAPARGTALRPRSLSKNADISMLDLNTVFPSDRGMSPKHSGDPSGQESSEVYWSSNRNSHESHNSRMDGSDKELLTGRIKDTMRFSEGYDDIHSVASTKVNPGSVVICLCSYVPAREDEFGTGFGDTFTVLKVFDDGWALCTKLSGPEHTVERILVQQAEVDSPKHIAKPNELDNETETLSPMLGSGHCEPTQTSNSVTSYQDTITVTTKRTFPVALSPRTKFLPLLTVTLLCNFGRVIRSGTCKFGAVSTLTALWPDKNLQSGGMTLMIGDMKIPCRAASLQFNAKKQFSSTLVDHQPISSRQAGAKSVRPGATKAKSEPSSIRGNGVPLTDPSGKVPVRPRSSDDIRSTKSMKATLKRSFGTLRRKFTQAGDAKLNPLRVSELLAEPMSEPVGKHVVEPMGKRVGDRGSGLQSGISLDHAIEEKNQELSGTDARLALEKGKRQETLEMILPARDPKRDKRAADSRRLIPRISFSILSFPGSLFSGFS